LVLIFEEVKMTRARKTVKMPSYKASIKVPKIKVPRMPKIKVPKIKLPKIK